MSDPTREPSTSPGEISEWPMLKIVYRTDPGSIAALLPPGIDTSDTSNVTLTIYNLPVNEEPEYGILITVDASVGGVPGEYAIGYGIDQESAIFISQFYQRATQVSLPDGLLPPAKQGVCALCPPELYLCRVRGNIGSGGSPEGRPRAQRVVGEGIPSGGAGGRVTIFRRTWSMCMASMGPATELRWTGRSPYVTALGIPSPANCPCWNRCRHTCGGRSI